MRIFILLLTTGLLISTDLPIGAQSLADVAKSEQARRKDVKVSSKVYTNHDLQEVPMASQSHPAAPVTEPSGAQPSSASVAAAPGAEPSATGKEDAAKGVTKDRTYWSTRMQESRARLDRDRTLVDALQTRVNSLAADFVNRDDPAGRAQIGLNRQRALDELDRTKKSVEAGEQAIAAIEEESRRAGVPPGWLR